MIHSQHTMDDVYVDIQMSIDVTHRHSAPSGGGRSDPVYPAQ